jgi:competence protein ComEC
LRVLASGERGAVLLLEWGSFHALLPIGLDFEILEELQADASLHGVDVLLLADCGSAPLNDPEWIEALRPRLVLLSVGAGDRYNRPAPETLTALESYTLLRTDLNGWIEVATDGEKMWVEAEQ